LTDGVFGKDFGVGQFGFVSGLSAAGIAATGGHIGTQLSQIFSAYWDDNEYAAGAGRMIITGDVDMISTYNDSAPYAPLNNNGRFALNSTAFLVDESAAAPLPTTACAGLALLGGLGLARRRRDASPSPDA
jgi:MYXO-CTERM domain-containing protein